MDEELAEWANKNFKLLEWQQNQLQQIFFDRQEQENG